MTRSEMWQEFLKAGEWGLKEQFKQLTDEEISKMSPTECICRCYCMLMDVPFDKSEFDAIDFAVEMAKDEDPQAELYDDARRIFA